MLDKILDRKIGIDKTVNISFNIRLNISIRGLIIAASALYLVWEICWAKARGYAVIKWHTHLAFYYYLFILFYTILYVYNKFYPTKNYTNFRVLLIAVFGTFMTLELSLMLLGVNQTLG